MKVVLDTNCLLVIAPSKSIYRPVFDQILNGEIELVLTTEILLEYEEQLEKFYSATYANLIINVILNLPNLILVNPIYFNWLLIKKDEDDNKFIDAYVAGKADLIITNDRHFNQIKEVQFPVVKCVRLIDFCKNEVEDSKQG